MILRGARPGDAAAIAAIANHYIRETTVTFTTLEKSPDAVAAEITARRRQGLAYLVADRADHVFGFATVFPFRNGPGYAHTMEHTVLLSPGAQGQAVGRQLLTALEDCARNAGIHSLIGGISAENDGGLRFHAAMGFAEVGRIPHAGRKFDRWIDLVLMQKLLSEERTTG